MAGTKAQYPYHGGQPKAGAGAGAEKNGRLMNMTRPSQGNSTANKPAPNPTQRSAMVKTKMRLPK